MLTVHPMEKPDGKENVEPIIYSIEITFLFVLLLLPICILFFICKILVAHLVATFDCSRCLRLVFNL